jgi:hypothetical protein
MFFSSGSLIRGCYKKFLNREVKAFNVHEDISKKDAGMWEKKSSGEFVKKTEKAVRKLADKKTASIEHTAEWMKKYQYAEWPANPDRVEQEMKNKIMTALADDMKQEPAFTAWVLYQVAGQLVADLEVKAIWE